MSILQQEEDAQSSLFFARNEYHIGNFMGSINSVLPEQGTANKQLLSYMYLSYIAMDSGRIVTSDIKENDSTPLLAIRLIQEALDQPERSEDILSKLTDKLVAEEDEFNIWHQATAIVYCLAGQYENALKILRNSTNLESLALTVQCLLQLNRPDLAKQQITKMQEISDDDSLTQLAQAWVAICQGTEQMQDAFHIYQELCEKYKPTPLLLNGLAVVHLGLDRYEEAEAVLKEALTKKHNDYNTLVNLMVTSYLSGKSNEHISRYIEQLKQSYPKSEVVLSMDKKGAEFDQLNLQFGSTVKRHPDAKLNY